MTTFKTLLPVTLCLLSITAIASPVQYFYQGNSLIPTGTSGVVINQFTSSDSLSFSFLVTDFLSPSSTYNSSTLLGWEANDGHYSYGHADAILYSLSITTDSLGNINHWDISGGSTLNPQRPELLFSMQSDFPMMVSGYPNSFTGDLVHHAISGSTSYWAISPVLGSWTVASAVPEPETYSMLLIGLGIFAGVFRTARRC